MFFLPKLPKIELNAGSCERDSMSGSTISSNGTMSIFTRDPTGEEGERLRGGVWVPGGMAESGDTVVVVEDGVL